MASQASEATGVTIDHLAKVSRTKVFFGHQSVGKNILDAVPGVYSAHGMTAPTIEQSKTEHLDDCGFIEHAFIGQNEHPLDKIRDFEEKMISGTGGEVDLAMMKLCYVDVMGDTDVDKLFAAYRTVFATLERDFPKVAFIKVTVPVTTDPALRSKLKSRLTGRTQSGPADNLARERLNHAIRQEYPGDQVFDLAAIESTDPDGKRVTGMYHGRQYYRLYDGYASDSGHLNGEGAHIVASAWLKAIAQASPR